MDNDTPNFDSTLRLRRLIDEDPFKPIDPHHELAPAAPPSTQTGGQLMAETLIGHSDKATDLVLDALDKWEAKIVEIREIVQKSRLRTHDAIRAHMLISETAMKGVDQIGQQLMDAVSTLASLNGGRE